MSPVKSGSSVALAALTIVVMMGMVEMGDPLAVSLARMKRQNNYVLYPEYAPQEGRHHFDASKSGHIAAEPIALSLLNRFHGAQQQQAQLPPPLVLTPETLEILRQLVYRHSASSGSSENMSKRGSSEDSISLQRQGRDWMTRLG